MNFTNTEEFFHISNSQSESVINISMIKNKTELIKSIREDIINGKYNLNNNENYYFEFEEEKLIIEITNTGKEINEKNNNKTIIDLGNCEYILKKRI